jgi:putative two-component system response regulator
MMAPAQGTILVVDDDPQVRGLLQRLLTHHGHAVVTAEDGDTAAGLIEDHHPDLIVMDIGLPDIDGVTLCRHLKETGAARALPVVLMSASTDFALPWQTSGADAFVRKPFNRDELLTWVRSLVLVKKAQDDSAQTEAVLVSLAALVESRSLHREDHIHRVSTLGAELAAAAGLGGETVTEIRRAGLLHDIGLIGVPEAILRKRLPLTPVEWAQVQQHSGTGAELCRSLPRGQAVTAIVRSHHERWDGGGYPDGLAGEAIPLGARIVAIADAYASMLTERPYRVAIPPGDALNVLEGDAGARWDPALVALFAAELGRAPGISVVT